MKQFALAVLIVILAALPIYAHDATTQIIPGAVSASHAVKTGAVFTTGTGAMRIELVSDSIAHVSFSADGHFPENSNPALIEQGAPTPQFTVTQGQETVTIATSKLRIDVALRNAAISFKNIAGEPLLQEDTYSGGKLLRANAAGADHSYEASDLFLPGADESFYGLGQHQSGVWNYSGESVDLSQDNTNISIPFFVSSRGYGVFWNNASRSRFNARLATHLYLSSEVADTIDYYFIYGPELDQVVAGYRLLTGAAPMFGKWAYGLWQCKNRYNSQAELLGVAEKYRQLHIPIDNIVQDWFWWTKMGSHIFNQNYPDPEGMVKQLHDKNFHVMISVWPFFEPGSENYTAFQKRDWLLAHIDQKSEWLPGAALYDALNSEARELYWKQIETNIFRKGFDAWWLDTTEPETISSERNYMLDAKTGSGPGARFANAYPLMTTMGVYQGQRKTTDQKRVFILTRSAFAGMQRNAAAAWSGDIFSNWTVFKRQVPAGLNYALSGLPYWTTDIGGFFDGKPDSPAYRELFVRWFQFGVFSPILRVHGTRNPDQNELWSYGPEAQKILTKFDALRYRLLPYTYSVAWKVTSESYTMMRPLVMEFRSDARSQAIGDQFLFGPSLLVNPVTDAGETTRRLYLPPTTWYDFWSGETLEGGRYIDAAAPLDSMPLYARAGSILPMGPQIEYTSEKPADPLEIRVYSGADGDFTLYEDEGDSYRYEQGMHATIPFHWDNAKQELNIGARSGSFAGMLTDRSFRIVWVGKNHGVGAEATEHPDRVVAYRGSSITIHR